MPDGSGFDVLNVIKKENLSMKIIMVTNFSNERFKIRALESGVDYFFDKSNDILNLVDTLNLLTK